MKELLDSVPVHLQLCMASRDFGLQEPLQVRPSELKRIEKHKTYVYNPENAGYFKFPNWLPSMQVKTTNYFFL